MAGERSRRYRRARGAAVEAPDCLCKPELDSYPLEAGLPGSRSPTIAITLRSHAEIRLDACASGSNAREVFLSFS